MKSLTSARQPIAELAGWLSSQKLSIAFSTYRANRLLLLGTGATENGTAPELKLQERLFDRPMGLYVAGESLWMATRSQLWRLDNHLAPGLSHGGGDRLYVPAASFVTGDVNAHELVLGAKGEPIFVNTAFSCLATVSAGCSFAPSWQPAFISKLAADDRCHLNGIALQDGIPTWASACGHSDGPSSWRHQRRDGGVLIHIPSGELAATGLSMPHSPRWHNGRLWLLNSGTGELGSVEQGRFNPLCALPGFTRGLAFSGNYAVVGLSKLRSPQFTGLALEQRLSQEGIPGGLCGLRVIDLARGTIVHSLDLPEPIDELFDVVVLPGVRQPRALELQGEELDCLVKLADQAELVRVRPKAPSGNPHQAPRPQPIGLPTPSTSPIHYQQVFHLTPASLAPYARLTYPALKAGSNALARLEGELLGLSAMANGEMVGLAIAERQAAGGASLRSLCVDPHWRRRGIGTGLLARLMRFVAQDGGGELAVSYQTTELSQAALEPMLKRLGWSKPKTEFVLLEGRAESLAAAPWAVNYPISNPYQVSAWSELSAQQQQQIKHINAPQNLLPPANQELIDLDVSIVLLHNQELVGWVLAERMKDKSLRYSSLFVAQAHRRCARGPALLAEAFKRQRQRAIPIARAAIAAENGAMIRLLKRHLKDHLTGISRARTSRALPGAQLP